MNTIQVYDPAMCCSTGVCGPEVDPVLPRFAGFLAQIATIGVRVERYNLAQQPMAFVQNPTVKALLDTGGVDVLPLILVDGKVALQGGYPSTEQYAAWMQAAVAGKTS
jgi:arsenite methyltransferase